MWWGFGGRSILLNDASNSSRQLEKQINLLKRCWPEGYLEHKSVNVLTELMHFQGTRRLATTNEDAQQFGEYVQGQQELSNAMKIYRKSLLLDDPVKF